MANDNNWPPCKWQATILDYDSDQSTEYPPLLKPLATNATSTNCHNNPATPKTNTAPTMYATELLQLKEEISQLKIIITAAVKQITQAIASFSDTSHPPTPNAMDIEADHKSSDNSPKLEESHHATLELSDTIKELQMELVQLTQETQTFTQQNQQKTNHHHSSATWS